MCSRDDDSHVCRGDVDDDDTTKLLPCGSKSKVCALARKIARTRELASVGRQSSLACAHEIRSESVALSRGEPALRVRCGSGDVSISIPAVRPRGGGVNDDVVVVIASVAVVFT